MGIYSLLITYYLLLITHYSLFITYYLLLIQVRFSKKLEFKKNEQIVEIQIEKYKILVGNEH